MRAAQILVHEGSGILPVVDKNGARGSAAERLDAELTVPANRSSTSPAMSNWMMLTVLPSRGPVVGRVSMPSGVFQLCAARPFR